MAKAKAKAKKKATPVHIPEGYRVIGRAASWDMDKEPVIEGERGEVKEFQFKDKETGEMRDARTFILQDETLGAVTVWESSGLRDMFDQSDEGDVLRLEFLGYGEAKKGQNAPRLFNCMIKETAPSKSKSKKR